MNRLALVTVLWTLVTLMTCKSDASVNATLADETVNIDTLNALLMLEDNRLSVDEDDGESNISNIEKMNDKETEDSITTYEDEDLDAALRKRLRRNRITDILVACFFFVAAIWLILATAYSIILLVLLRLQARGELDIYDENLGRVVLCNGRFTVHFGCILRRYAIQLEEDYQRQLQRRFGNSDSDNEERQPIRIMTREERRKAVEELLLGNSSKEVDVEARIMDNKFMCKPCKPVCSHTKIKTEASKKSSGSFSPNTSFSSSDEGPVCSICLVEYEPTDSVFRSKSCPHMFHGDCLFSWLERRNNTECPCCRESLVSDDDIWEVVQRMRKEQRQRLRKENGMIHRLVNWAKKKTHQAEEDEIAALHPQVSERTDSSTSLSSGSDEILDQQSSSETEPEDIVESDTNDQEGSSAVIGDGNTDDHETSPIGIDDGNAEDSEESEVKIDDPNDDKRSEESEVKLGDAHTGNHEESVANLDDGIVDDHEGPTAENNV